MDRHMDILEKQEAMLRFDHFDNAAAYALGTFMVQYAKDNGILIAVSIRLNNGAVVFQHLPDGTGGWHENWMRRKFNTVSLMECSSLMAKYRMESTNDTLEGGGLSLEDYALCGGGFPIRLKDSDTVLGAVMASNLHHIKDHEFVTGCLRAFLQCPDAPEYPFDPEG